MPTMAEAEGVITALPEVTERTRYGRPTWFVDGTAFARERPFSKADIRRFGDEPVPAGPILAVTVEDLAEKAAVLAAGNDGVFTIEHFDDYPAVLIQLDVVERAVLGELITDAWLASAPEALARAYLDASRSD